MIDITPGTESKRPKHSLGLLLKVYTVYPPKKRKRHVMNKRIYIIIMATLIVLLTACGSSSQVISTDSGAGKTEEVIEGTSLENAIAEGSISELLTDGVMSVGVGENLSSFIGFNEKGEAEGIGLSVINELGSKLNIKTEIKQLAGEETLPAIGDAVDIGVIKTSTLIEKTDSILVSDIIYTSAQSVIVPADSELEQYEDMLGKRIGCLQNSDAEVFIEGLCAEDGTTEMKIFANADEAFNEFSDGKLDVLIVGQEIAQEIPSSISDKIKTIEGSVFGIEDEGYAIAIPNGDTVLLEQINEVVSGMKVE